MSKMEARANQNWMTSDILQKMERRRQEKSNVGKYNKLDAEIKRECQTAKEMMLTAQCEKTEQLDAVPRVLMNRLRARSLVGISQVQYDFMSDRGTRNEIFVLCRLLERSIQKQKNVFTCFIDYSNAFDTMKHASLVDLLSYLDVESHYIKLLANPYWNQQAAVRHNGEVSESPSNKAFDMGVSPRRICLHCTMK